MTQKSKQAVNFNLDKDLLGRVEKYRQSQDAPPSKTAVHEAALKEFLDRREIKKKKPAE
jgi:predicted transcriptional regulator